MRQRKDFKRQENIKSDRLIIIAAEGRCTENIYFNEMKLTLMHPRVHVEVLMRDDNNSSPENVYEQIKEFERTYDIGEEDQLWVVVDTDRWPEKMLSSVAQFCSQSPSLYFCVSNPCFELWLLLHLEDIAAYSEEVRIQLAENKKVNSQDTWLKHRMKELTGHYHESDYDAGSLLQNIDAAIQRAEDLDVNPADRWPQTVGTRVYLLAKSIMSFD